MGIQQSGGLINPPPVMWPFNPNARPTHAARWGSAFYEMITHTWRHNARKLLFQHRPTESPETLDYRTQNEEGITTGPITRATNEIFSAILGGKYSYEVDESIADYIKEPRFGLTTANRYGYNFWQYLRHVVCPRMRDDPNGYFVWLPERYGDVTKKIEPDAYLVFSISIIELSEERITFLRPEQLYTVDARGVPLKIFVSIDKHYYWYHQQLTDENDNAIDKYSSLPYYYHGLGFIPIVSLGGVYSSAAYAWDDRTAKSLQGEPTAWMPFNMSGGSAGNNVMGFPLIVNYFESFFRGYIPMANDFIKFYSDYKISWARTAHPVIVEKAIDCRVCQGRGTRWDAENNRDINCGHCHGTGSEIPSKSPAGTYLVKVADTEKIPTGNNPAQMEDPFSYIVPPHEGLRFQWDACKEMLIQAEKEIYQFYTDKVQSGDAKEIDREGKYNMILTLNDHIFDHNAINMLWILTLLRNINNPTEPEIIKPTDFKVKDELDLIEERKAMVEANVPLSMRLKVDVDLAKRRFSGDEKPGTIIILLSLWDTLYDKSQDDYVNILGGMPQTEADDLKRRHLYADRVIGQILNEQGEEWLDKDTAIQLSDMDAKYATLISTIPKAIANPLLPNG